MICDPYLKTLAAKAKYSRAWHGKRLDKPVGNSLQSSQLPNWGSLSHITGRDIPTSVYQGVSQNFTEKDREAIERALAEITLKVEPSIFWHIAKAQRAKDGIR